MIFIRRKCSGNKKEKIYIQNSSKVKTQRKQYKGYRELHIVLLEKFTTSMYTETHGKPTVADLRY